MVSTDILVVAGGRCRECIRRRLAEMSLTVQVEISAKLHPGDLAIIDGGTESPQVFIGICHCGVCRDGR